MVNSAASVLGGGSGAGNLPDAVEALMAASGTPRTPAILDSFGDQGSQGAYREPICIYIHSTRPQPIRVRGELLICCDLDFGMHVIYFYTYFSYIFSMVLYHRNNYFELLVGIDRGCQ